MITNRQKDILKFIVEEYVKTVKPVSSNVICEHLNCSSATIRNEMVILEELGFLEKNHYASGRQPSEAGYKYYVENLMTPKDLTGEDMLKLQTIFHNQTLVLSDAIEKSLQLITELTNYTSVVLGKTSSENRLKKVEVISLEEYKVLTMLITDKGYVEYKNLYLPNTDIEEVIKTVNLINKMIAGTPINEINEKLEYDVKPIIGQYVKQHEVLYNAFYDAFASFTNKASDIHFTGKNNFLKQPEFNNIEKVKELLNKFDDVETISEMEEQKNGINIYIGKESELSDDVSVIKTKYNYDGEEGTIAIIGPKRMEYERVVNLLNYIKENIEEKTND
ncbi:MAG: heat-inducible transcriptional repressor HrcA [Mycoplasmatota bacterium]|nr:heat-inducible transcriptional repressor HrcA [Mycoplasmatota bacterium]